MPKKYIIVNDHGYLVEVDKDKYDSWKDYTQLMYGNGYEASLHDCYLLLNPLSTHKFGPEPIQLEKDEFKNFTKAIEVMRNQIKDA